LREVRFTAEAETDLIAAARFYAQESSSTLGEALIDEVARACRLLQEAPLTGRAWRGQTRRLVLRRFPFNLIYRVHEDEIQLIAVAHQRRKPRYWSP